MSKPMPLSIVVIAEPRTTAEDETQRVAWCASCSVPVAFGQGVVAGPLGRIHCRECAADLQGHHHE